MCTRVILTISYLSLVDLQTSQGQERAASWRLLAKRQLVPCQRAYILPGAEFGNYDIWDPVGC